MNEFVNVVYKCRPICSYSPFIASFVFQSSQVLWNSSDHEISLLPE